MKAEDIRTGDQFIDDGAVHYTVLAIIPGDTTITARVQWEPWQGGGIGTRTWHRGDEVPLTRIEAKHDDDTHRS